ncbi:inositol monophosphatase family protein [Halomarina halobia]|uniref:Inositol monophosphatase family protein n=1 Tax=Halomarina halobia TaxID=3033386 RepID=A0ABD6AEU1_9EURY|nr:inositol monophosphatase family protein [Halomarina sp. PSR21]
MTSQPPVANAHLRTAVDAAERAAAIHRRDADVTNAVEYKSRRDLVTAVDREAERAVRSLLTQRFPDHAVLGEESGQDGEGTNRWIVDPLDGTTNYCHGVPHYGVSIALERRGRLDVGVVHHTPTGDTYTAVRGEGAYRNGEPLSVSSTDAVEASLVGTGFSPGTEPDQRLLEVLQSVVHSAHGVRRFGSATAELVAVANGTLDAYYRTDLSPWDTAAGILLVEEAGGTVTDFRGSHANRRETVLATNGRSHDEFERFIRRRLDD